MKDYAKKRVKELKLNGEGKVRRTPKHLEL